jgi:hypothetical protein
MMSTGVVLVFGWCSDVRRLLVEHSLLCPFHVPTARALGPAAGPVMDHAAGSEGPHGVIGCGADHPLWVGLFGTTHGLQGA